MLHFCKTDAIVRDTCTLYFEPCNFTLNRFSESEIVTYTRVLYLRYLYQYTYHSYHMRIWEYRMLAQLIRLITRVCARIKRYI
jgi:hypothetical protein